MFHLTQLFFKATNRLQNQLFTQLKTQDPLNLFKMMPGSPGTSHRADPGANPGPGSGTVPLPLGSPSSQGWEQASLHKLTAGKYVGAAHALLKSSFVLSYSHRAPGKRGLSLPGICTVSAQSRASPSPQLIMFLPIPSKPIFASMSTKDLPVACCR